MNPDDEATSSDPAGPPDADEASGAAGVPGTAGSGRRRRERTAMLLRLDPAVHEALTRWAGDELRSTNAHVEWLLRRALNQAGRLPPGGS